jgi:hypothetical protein
LGKKGKLYAKDHPVPVVRRQSGRGNEFLRFHFQEFEGRVDHTLRRGRAGAERNGHVRGGPLFKFTEAISFFVNCETQQEVDELWDKLSSGGKPSRCGWLKDKYGLSWQIIPSVLGRMLGDKDPAKAQRVMQAMLQMEKIDIAKLRQAYDQN